MIKHVDELKENWQEVRQARIEKELKEIEGVVQEAYSLGKEQCHMSTYISKDIKKILKSKGYKVFATYRSGTYISGWAD